MRAAIRRATSDACPISSSWPRPMAGRASASRTRGELDDGIAAMLAHDGPVMVDCRVAKLANCFPMIPSGAAHTE